VAIVVTAAVTAATAVAVAAAAAHRVLHEPPGHAHQRPRQHRDGRRGEGEVYVVGVQRKQE
jgi:hypothetical protein